MFYFFINNPIPVLPTDEEKCKKIKIINIGHAVLELHKVKVPLNLTNVTWFCIN